MKATVRETLKYGSSVALKNSFLLTGLFIVYFLLAQVAGFARILEFRYFNYVIAFVVAYYTVKAVYIHNNYYLEYFTGLLIGIMVITLGQFWYSLLFFIYLNIDQKFLSFLLSQLPYNVVAPKFSIAALLLSEGIGLSTVIALTLMQYFKWTSARWTHAS